MIKGRFLNPNYEAVRKAVFSLKEELEQIGIDKKSCHIDLVPENFIEGPKTPNDILQDFCKYEFFSLETGVLSLS